MAYIGKSERCKVEFLWELESNRNFHITYIKTLLKLKVVAFRLE